MLLEVAHLASDGFAGGTVGFLTQFQQIVQILQNSRFAATSAAPSYESVRVAV